MNEIWKEIPGYEGYYEVSNLGRVKTISRTIKRSCGRSLIVKERIRKLTIDRKGYHRLPLTKDKKVKHFRVHQLVAMTFLNHKIDSELVVDHIDNDKQNNNVINLQLITNRLNCSKDKKGSSKYTGVHWNKQQKKYNTTIRIEGKTKYLGSYINEYDAHLAYQKALKSI